MQKIIVALMLILVSTTSMIQANQPSNRPQQLFQSFDTSRMFQMMENMPPEFMSQMLQIMPNFSELFQYSDDIIGFISVFQSGQYDQAVEIGERLLTQIRKQSSDGRMEAYIKQMLVTAYVATGQFDRAEITANEMIAFYGKTIGKDAFLLAPMRLNLAIVYLKKQQWQKAEIQLTSALAFTEQAVGAQSGTADMIRLFLAVALYKQGKQDEALAHLRPVLQSPGFFFKPFLSGVMNEVTFLELVAEAVTTGFQFDFATMLKQMNQAARLSARSPGAPQSEQNEQDVRPAQRELEALDVLNKIDNWDKLGTIMPLARKIGGAKFKFAGRHKDWMVGYSELPKLGNICSITALFGARLAMTHERESYHLNLISSPGNLFVIFSNPNRPLDRLDQVVLRIDQNEILFTGIHTFTVAQSARARQVIRHLSTGKEASFIMALAGEKEKKIFPVPLSGFTEAYRIAVEKCGFEAGLIAEPPPAVTTTPEATETTPIAAARSSKVRRTIEQAVRKQLTAARTALKMGNYAEAHQHATDALSYFDDPAFQSAALEIEAWLERAKIYEKRSQLQLAQDDLYAAMRISAGQTGQQRLTVLRQLAALLVVRGQEASNVLQEAQQLSKSIYGVNHTETQILGLLSDIQPGGRLQQCGNPAEGLEAVQAVLNHAGWRMSTQAQQLVDLAELFTRCGHYGIADRVLEKGETLVANTLNGVHPDVASLAFERGQLYRIIGDSGRAVGRYMRALRIQERLVGADHPITGLSRHRLGRSLVESGNYELGVRYARQAAKGAVHWLLDEIQASRGNQPRWRVAEGILEAHLDFISSLSESKQRAFVDDSFIAAQALRMTKTAQATANLLGRLDPEAPHIKTLVRDYQQAVEARRRLDDQLLDAFMAEGAPKPRAATEAIDQSVQRVEARIRDARQALEQEYPEYFQTVILKPIYQQRVVSELDPHQALISFLVRKNRIYLWFVSGDQQRFEIVVFEYEKLKAQIENIRRSMDVSTKGRTAFAFDAAYDLYEHLFSPLKPLLQSVDHLILIPDGPLEELPFAALITAAPPQQPNGQQAYPPFWYYQKVAWLGKAKQLSVLPAVYSFKVIKKAHEQPSAASQSFVGIGAPMFSSSTASTGVCSAQGVGTPEQHETLTRYVRTLDPLDQTDRVLYALSGRLGYSESQLLLAERASESVLKNGIRLDPFRYVMFATHGLTAETLAATAPANGTRIPAFLREPGLALTPPGQASACDDGFLSAGEIAQLRLDADWVMLTACDTASPDGQPGSELFSGLARAFFVAGARSLLVTHMPVQAEAMVEFMLRVFDGLGHREGQQEDRAAAIRAAIMAFVDGQHKPQYRHPMFWAPFIYVGL